MTDYKDLEFLAERAKELLDRQISSYRANHTKAGTMIGICSINVPIFLFIIEKSPLIIQILAVIPIMIFLYSIIQMIMILRSDQLYHGFNQDQFDELIKQDYESMLLYDIGAKKDSITDNQDVTKKQNKRFNRGLKATVLAIFLSITLLAANMVNNTNNKTMEKKANTVTTEAAKDKKPDVSTIKARVIPQVCKEARMVLNEGKIPKSDSTKMTK